MLLHRIAGLDFDPIVLSSECQQGDDVEEDDQPHGVEVSGHEEHHTSARKEANSLEGDDAKDAIGSASDTEDEKADAAEEDGPERQGQRFGRVNRSFFEADRDEDDTGNDRCVGVGVGVSKEPTPFLALEFFCPVFERWLDSIEVRPPQQASCHPGGDQRNNDLGRETAALGERFGHGTAEGNDDLAERDDDDQTVTFCKVPGPEHPFSLDGEERRTNHDEDRQDPRGLAQFILEECTNHEHRHRHEVGPEVVQR